MACLTSREGEVCLARPTDGSSLLVARLLEAAAQGDEGLVRALIQQGADPLYQDAEGHNALMQAAAHGHEGIVGLLLEAGVPWNAIDKEGNCAGDLAVAAAHESTAEMLLEAGMRAELVLGALERKLGGQPPAPQHQYLQQRLQYDAEERLMDAEDRAVMMAWEGPLMEAHAHAICSSGGDVLNVGFGMGLIDEAIQRRRPRSHTIVEAHPDVHARMLQQGWDRKPGVRILFGRWQDVLPEAGLAFDGIFWDTFSEYYEDMQEFHALLPRLLKADGTYSYFNGLAADNAFFHMVYCNIASAELQQLGLETEYVPLPIDCSNPKVWEGVRNRYWQLDTYMLPVCTLTVTAGDSGPPAAE
ncbi:hypothetical protein CVIRNUC_000900 [Coccomyxa viridis]|uniref:Protein arginine N-methyltransferase 2 n=1 Tax=Coccomyxa viridis TaxID=1274662 RepID=A0AAV1HW24_9CHLO|nr:hypothetical protein CVIRNUC_000900 [Coccomyxa viridis]